MPVLPIQWAIQTDDGRQPAASGAELHNLYAIEPVDPRRSKTPVVLYGTPGHESVGTLTTSDGPATSGDVLALAMVPLNGVQTLLALTRQVVGAQTSLALFKLTLARNSSRPSYEFTVSQSATTTLTALSSSGVSRLVAYGTKAVALYDGHLHAWDITDSPAGRTVSLPTGHSGNFVDIGISEGHFVFIDADGFLLHTRRDSLAVDPISWSRDRTQLDNMKGLAVFNRRLYLFGVKSIEQWDYTGEMEFAFRRADAYVSDNLGGASAASIATNEEGTFFLGSDNIVYTFSGKSGLRPLSNEAVGFDVAQSDSSQATAYTYTEENHRFYSLTLAMNDGTKKNWTIDLSTGLWHNRSLDSVRAIARVDEHNFIGLAGSVAVYHYSLNYGTERGQPVERWAVSPVLHGNQRRVTCHEFQADMPLLHQDNDLEGIADDRVKLEWSDDAKETWKPDQTIDTPRSTTQTFNGKRKRWVRLGQFRRGRNFRLTITAKRRIQVLSAYADIMIDRT